jgi:hypothetical protein
MTWPFAPPASDHEGIDHDREERLVGDILSDEWPDSPLKFLNRRRPLPGDRSANAKAEPDTTCGGGLSSTPLQVVSPSLEGLPDE